MRDDDDQRKSPRKVSPAALERAAIHYLERFSSSSANLRRLLKAKAERSVREHDTDREEAAGWVEAVLAKLSGLGYLDDGRYAMTRARSLNAKGRSASAIRMDLSARGVDPQSAAAALEALSEQADDPELAAAASLARRRRLGPFRPEEQRADLRAKDLATFARAGFSFQTARRVVDAASPEELAREVSVPGRWGENG